jgi:O-succinylbenzoate synthase
MVSEVVVVSARGLLLRLRAGDAGDDAGDLVGEGEASPLPGYSPDTFDTARAALLGRGPPTPAADMASFAARLDLDGKQRGLAAHAILGATRERLALYALVADLDAAAAAWARGIRALKVKVGRDAAAEIAFLAALRRQHPDAELRLDANGRAVDGAALAAFAPVYLEEPLGASAGGAIPLALDESLQRMTDDAVAARLAGGEVAALVLKPMTLGPGRCFALARLAERHGVPVTVTHTFDGPLALAAAAAVALALPGRVLAVGLDRHAGLAAWPPATVAALGAYEIRATGAPGLGVSWT